MKTFIVIPCYNEEKNITDVLKRINALSFEKKVIVVDDGSSDNSCELIGNNFKNVILLKHKINLGKGAALKTGCEAAMKLGKGVIVLMDADGQHSPEIIPEMVKKMEKENLEIIFSSRNIEIGKLPFTFYFGNKFLTNLISFFSGVKLRDSLSGFRAFKSSVYQKLEWQSSGYPVETEIIMNAGKNKLKYGEIMIDPIYFDGYKGTTPFDSVSILFCLFKKKFL